MDKTLLHQPQWRVIDQSALGPNFPALQSFAIDDTLCTTIGSNSSPATARAWVHHHTVVLGIQDARLPFLKEGLEYLEEKGYRYLVRNSGGLAVVLDEGVLNLSLVLPETDKGIEINAGYDTMWFLIKEMFSEFTQEIDAREIVGSYCPGSYDLSINGKKFAGISQRRVKKGVAVQIYLSVTGSGSERAELVRQFYLRAKGSVQTKIAYPEIVPDVMASLSELYGQPLTIQDVMLRFLTVLKNNSEHIFSGNLTEEELALFESYYERVVVRNEKMLEAVI